MLDPRLNLMIEQGTLTEDTMIQVTDWVTRYGPSLVANILKYDKSCSIAHHFDVAAS